MATKQASPTLTPSFSPLYIPGPGVSLATLFYWADYRARVNDHARTPENLQALRVLALIARRELRYRVPARPGNPVDPEPWQDFFRRAKTWAYGPVELPEGMTPGPWVTGPYADLGRSA